MLELKQIKIR